MGFSLVRNLDSVTDVSVRKPVKRLMTVMTEVYATREVEHLTGSGMNNSGPQQKEAHCYLSPSPRRPTLRDGSRQ